MADDHAVWARVGLAAAPAAAEADDIVDDHPVALRRWRAENALRVRREVIEGVRRAVAEDTMVEPGPTRTTPAGEIGRGQVRTPVTNAQLGCRRLMDKKKHRK